MGESLVDRFRLEGFEVDWHRRAGDAHHAFGRTTLSTYPWPGNLRELRHCIERACILSGEATLEPDSLFEDWSRQRMEQASAASTLDQSCAIASAAISSRRCSDATAMWLRPRRIWESAARTCGRR